MWTEYYQVLDETYKPITWSPFVLTKIIPPHD